MDDYRDRQEHDLKMLHAEIANLRAINAEMLEALKAVLDVLKWNDVDEVIGPTGIGNVIRAAIEKAEGGAQK